MRGGASAPDALAALLADDADREVRQVGMVDASGPVRGIHGRAMRGRGRSRDGRRTLGPGEHDGAPDRLAGDGRGVPRDRRATGGPAPGRAPGRRGRGRGRAWSAVRCAARRPGVRTGLGDHATTCASRTTGHRSMSSPDCCAWRVPTRRSTGPRTPAMAGDLAAAAAAMDGGPRAGPRRRPDHALGGRHVRGRGPDGRGTAALRGGAPGGTARRRAPASIPAAGHLPPQVGPLIDALAADD